MVRERAASRTHIVAPPEVAERVALAPAPGEAPLPAPNAAALLRRNGTDPDFAARPALRFGERIWTHAEMLRRGDPLRRAVPRAARPDAPAARGGAPRQHPRVRVLPGRCGPGRCGGGGPQPHPARRAPPGRHRLHRRPAARHRAAPPGAAGAGGRRPRRCPGGLLVSERFADGDDPPAPWASRSTPPWRAWAPGTGDPGLEPDVETLWVLLFTSGTSAAPKAVRCTQRRLLTTGNRMTMVLDVGPDDVGYLAMPLFHSNSLMVGLAPALVAGASVGLARRFSASRFLDDVRRYGATWFNYTGKPLAYLLATPERPDDADNPLRLAYGNEGSPHVVEAVAKRFGVAVVDVFGSTEGGIALDRSGGVPRGSVGKLRQGIKVVDPDGNERPRAVFDAEGRLVNAEECVGEIVNVEGVGPFEGYYRNDEAMARTTRNGWYWSGDLGYVDDRRLGVLRGTHLGLAPGGRRELPGRADRGHRGPPSRRHAGVGLRRARRRLRATRSWRRWCCATVPCFDPVGLRRLGRRARAT